MYLIGTTDALADLGVDNTVDLKEGTVLALEAATAQLTGDLRNGSFDRVTRTDIFWVDVRLLLTPVLRGELKLTSGFVDKNQTFTIVAGSDWNDLTNTPPVDPYLNFTAQLGATLDITQYVTIDYEAGKVSLTGMWLDMFPWIKVTYTAGFAPFGGSPAETDLYDPAQVPTWLQKLCLMGARCLLADTIPSKESGQKTDPSRLVRAYNTAVGAKSRYMPGATLPMSSQLA
jgi:hypothetical protein